VKRTTATQLPSGCGEKSGEHIEDRYFTYILPDSHSGEALGQVRWAEGFSRWGNPIIIRGISGGVVKSLQAVEEEQVKPEVKKKVAFKKEEEMSVKKEPEIPPVRRKRAYRPWPSERGDWRR